MDRREELTVDNELLNSILFDENYGKGSIKLPEGTVVPEGEIVRISCSDQRGGAGMMQGTIVYVCNRELIRSDDSKYYYSFYMRSEGKETNERYEVPDEVMKAIDRLVKNSCLAGCGNLKHDCIPGFFAPFNTPAPVNNILLELKVLSGENISIPLSLSDIGSNGGNDIMNAFFTLLDSLRS